jgi:plastocyanin
MDLFGELLPNALKIATRPGKYNRRVTPDFSSIAINHWAESYGAGDRVRSLCAIALLASLCACSGGTIASPTTVSAAPLGPQTWQMTTGASGTNEAFQALAFYPSSLTIDAGDTVKATFPTGEAHTLTFLGPRSTPPSVFDPTNAARAGGTSYDGSTYTSSGFLLQGGTYSLTFPKPGTYTYLCLIHPGMQGTIVVQPAGSPYPTTQTAIDAAGATQEASDLALGSAAVAAFPFTAGGPHLAAGMSPGLNTGKSPITVLRFIDGDTVDQTSVTVPVGSSVTWTNLSSNEPHTVTFGIANQPFPTISNSAPASGGTTYDGTHIVNSGVLPSGASFTLTFLAKGTFTYHCLFHDDTEHMIGTVVVQ